MGDITGISPIRGDVMLSAGVEAKQPLLAPIGGASSGAGTKGFAAGGGNGGNGASYQTPDALVAPMPKADPNAHAGPPPAFQVSLLDLDAQLRDTLARIDVGHWQERDVEAVSPETPKPGPAPEPKVIEQPVATPNDLLPGDVAAALSEGSTAQSQTVKVEEKQPI